MAVIIRKLMPIKGSKSTAPPPAFRDSSREANRRFALGLVRALGGAILFSLPMNMTMELWWLGFYMSPARLALYILLDIPLLVGVSYYAGFEETSRRTADVLDAFAAWSTVYCGRAV